LLESENVKSFDFVVGFCVAVLTKLNRVYGSEATNYKLLCNSELESCSGRVSWLKPQRQNSVKEPNF